MRFYQALAGEGYVMNNSEKNTDAPCAPLPRPSWLVRLWFALSLSIGFTAGLVGLFTSAGAILEIIFLHAKFHFLLLGSLFLAPLPVFLFLTLMGRPRAAVWLEIFGTVSILVFLAGAWRNTPSGFHTAGLITGAAALIGFRFCRPVMLPNFHLSWRALLSAHLMPVLFAIFLVMGLNMDEFSFVPDSILLFGKGTGLFAWAAMILLPVLFLSPVVLRIALRAVTGLFLIFYAALAWETHRLISLYQNNPPTTARDLLGPGDIYVTSGWKTGLWAGAAALAILCLLLWLNGKKSTIPPGKAPGNT